MEATRRKRNDASARAQAADEKLKKQKSEDEQYLLRAVASACSPHK
jgi:hypothetical protein